mmetsp:Transcript_139166/g.242026  ORF Transcript_139166/g.242026 Transcript_139166/m.242026 type:complete len:96 (-) Transcript_139166:756-1043(-)
MHQIWGRHVEMHAVKHKCTQLATCACCVIPSWKMGVCQLLVPLKWSATQIQKLGSGCACVHDCSSVSWSIGTPGTHYQCIAVLCRQANMGHQEDE